MIDVANEHLALCHAGAGHLRMATEAEVGIALRQELGVDRAVRIVASGAALAQRGVLKHERPSLLTMALGAGFIGTRHCQPAAGCEDVAAVRVVTLGAVNFLLQHRMMVGQVQLGLGLAMALEAVGRVAPGIDDELAPPASGGNMQTGGAMAGFTTGLADAGNLCEMDACMGAAGKHPGNWAVAFGAGFIPHKSGAWHRRRIRRQRSCRTGVEECGNGQCQSQRRDQRTKARVKIATDSP